MLSKNPEIYDVIVIGAGQAGLSAGYFLNKHQLNYLIFERGSVGESWLNQRWDSLKLDTPGWMNCLPGQIPDTAARDKFMDAKVFHEGLTKYVELHRIPVKEGYHVTSAEKDESTGLFNMETNHNGKTESWLARKVIVASGMLNEPIIPAISKNMPATITQLHSSEYRNPGQLPEGNILIVGSAKSGSQIAEELSDTGRKVYLASSKVGRMPRRYRGAEITSWLVKSGYFEMKQSEEDPSMLNNGVPFLISGSGVQGHTLSLQGLYRQGVTILGKLLEANDGKLHFGTDTLDNIRFGDEVSLKVKQIADKYIDENGIAAGDGEPDEADLPDAEGSSASSFTELDIAEHRITSVIWATGLQGNLGWLKLPVFDQQHQLIHQEGVSEVDGLFFLGLPWLRTRKSGVIYGMQDDAAFITDQLAAQLPAG